MRCSVCSVSLFFFLSRHETGAPISCVQPGDAWGDWITTGRSGNIRNGGPVKKRERLS